MGAALPVLESRATKMKLAVKATESGEASASSGNKQVFFFLV